MRGEPRRLHLGIARWRMTHTSGASSTARPPNYRNDLKAARRAEAINRGSFHPPAGLADSLGAHGTECSKVDATKIDMDQGIRATLMGLRAAAHVLSLSLNSVSYSMTQ